MCDAHQESHRGTERCDLRESEVNKNHPPGDDVEAQIRVDREDHEAGHDRRDHEIEHFQPPGPANAWAKPSTHVSTRAK